HSLGTHAATASSSIPSSKIARVQHSSAIQKPSDTTGSTPVPNAPPPPTSNVIYSGFQNIAIPTGFTGVYINIDNGSTAFAQFTGWDINPFFGGVGVGNSPAFQPARTGTGNQD